jgi:hypothetical protein
MWVISDCCKVRSIGSCQVYSSCPANRSTIEETTDSIKYRELEDIISRTTSTTSVCTIFRVCNLQRTSVPSKFTYPPGLNRVHCCCKNVASARVCHLSTVRDALHALGVSDMKFSERFALSKLEWRRNKSENERLKKFPRLADNRFLTISCLKWDNNIRR